MADGHTPVPLLLELGAVRVSMKDGHTPVLLLLELDVVRVSMAGGHAPERGILVMGIEDELFHRLGGIESESQKHRIPRDRRPASGKRRYLHLVSG